MDITLVATETRGNQMNIVSLNNSAIPAGEFQGMHTITASTREEIEACLIAEGYKVAMDHGESIRPEDGKTIYQMTGGEVMAIQEQSKQER